MMIDSKATLTYDRDAGQVVLERLPTGPAGGVSLTAADGLELIFDCADGTLSQVLVDTRTAGESGFAMAGTLLGPQVRDSLRQALRQHGTPIALNARVDVIEALSRLARLDAARLTSPDSRSPWWAVEAAQLATRARLTARATTEIHRTIRALDEMGDESTASVPPAALVGVADLVEAAEPGLAQRLRDRARKARPVTGQPTGVRPCAPLDSSSAAPGLHWWLDPRAIPPGIFRHAWWPPAELLVQAKGDGILIQADLMPGADHRLLRDCRVRLVDPAARKVIAATPFGAPAGSRVIAELHALPVGNAWVEVVDDASRPVLSAELHHIRRAMRWAAAALRAGRRPPGPVDAEWIRAEALAWERCAADWSAAGDEDRSYLAARHAARYPGVPAHDPPSAWAKELAGRPLLREEPFLAETACS